MVSNYVCLIFFFFKQKTAYEMRISDWSSDVCSSDLRKLNDSSNTQHRGSKKMLTNDQEPAMAAPRNVPLRRESQLGGQKWNPNFRAIDMLRWLLPRCWRRPLLCCP